MAAAPQSYDNLLRQPAAPQSPLPGAVSPPQTRPSVRPLYRPVIFALALSAVLVCMIAGHAQMMDANSERVRLIRQLRSAEKQQLYLSTSLMHQKEKANVDLWAQQNGMIRAIEAGPAVVIGPEAQKGQ